MKLKPILLLASLIFPCTAFAFSNEPEGFRGYIWGDKFELHKSELTLTEVGKSEFTYHRKGEKLKIGDADLTDVSYVFTKNGFSRVLINSSESTNAIALIKAFNERFGENTQPNRDFKDYYWNGKKVSIRLNCSNVNSECTATIESNELREALIKKDLVTDF